MLVPNLSSRQWFSTRESSALWRRMEMCAGILGILLGNVLGPGQGCWTACNEQDSPTQWGTVWLKMSIVPSLKTLWMLGGREWGLWCSQVCPQHLAQGLVQTGSTLNTWSVKYCMCGRSILWHQLIELKCLLQAYFENQGVNSSVIIRLKIWRKNIPPGQKWKFSLGVGKKICSLSLRSYWILHHLPFRDLSGAEE